MGAVYTSRIKSIGLFLLSFVMLLLVQQAASMLGGRLANGLGFAADDPANPFCWITMHHIVQLAVGLIIIWIIWKSRRLNFHLRPRKSKLGILYLLLFSAIVFILTVVGFHLMYASSADIPYQYELSARNIIGVLAFQLLLSGPSEEIIFRALPITAFCAVYHGRHQRMGQWAAILAAAMLFAIGHISWYTNPFRLSFSWFQLCYSFLYGVAYGVVYLQTDSVIYPMAMHSVSNLIMVGMGYVYRIVLPW